MKKAVAVIGAMAAVLLLTLTWSFAEEIASPDINRECVDKFLDWSKTLPEKEFVETLDGKKFSLEMLNFYSRHGTSSDMPYKFYYWQFDMKEIQYKGKQYFAKIYWCPGSACYGRSKNRLYGDIAEIYQISEDGELSFRLFAILAADDEKNGIYVIITPSLKKKSPRMDM